jgi:hypothetical protein
MSDPIVLITAEDLQAQQAAERDLESKIANDQRRLAEIREWLRAAAVLTGSKPPSNQPQRNIEVVTENGSVAMTNSAGGMTDNLTEAIARIVNNSPVSVPKADLKKMLAKEGFAGDRLANYFYTAIHRLKAKDRITVHADGSVWRAPQKN